MRSVSVFLASMLAVNAAPALAGEDKNGPIVLEPSSHWNVDFGNEKCRLARIFGEGEEAHVLMMDQGGPDSNFDLIVAGPKLKRFRSSSRVEIRFGQLPLSTRSPLLGELGDFGPSLFYSELSFGRKKHEHEVRETDVFEPLWTELPKLNVRVAGEVDRVTFRYGSRQLVFDTGSLAEAISVMNKCTRGMLALWGLDPDAHDDMTRMPIWSNQAEVVRRIAAQYPSSALRKGKQGVFRMRVSIGVDGSVTDCRLEDVTVIQSLESPACKEMQRAKFEPALDKDGKPMQSFYMTNIVYRIGR